ncbi:enoyl-CoA hydratase/isomerase family protein [Lujinxingia vulgaris]|uniref:Enoyl-CoA hydratase/isomerase family protein n=1 Tax=Lujinxingia vulgaris TaxID=2600176 RepID=A0A5C6WZI7_9DELT|nr:enoyl-CoA hydratase/isomerase family protein [Lujinxingia vulgaris]TXD34188.1 enoyl-CoA hydratase/isomerase family protein [Lujinxingia vulgaris]
MVVRCEERLEGRVWWVEIAREERLNAVNAEVMAGLEGVLVRAERTPELRVLVVGGAGRAFVSGGDLREFAGLRERKEVEAMSRRMRSILERIEALRCWTVARVNGDAYGGGVELMLAFDMCVVSELARLGLTQGRFGLTPGWGGLTRLVEKVGRARALKWLGCAEVLDAGEAYEAGLVEEVVGGAELDVRVMALAERLAGCEPGVAEALKEGARRAVEERRDVAMAGELEAFCELWVGEAHWERVERFLGRKG